MEKNNKNNFDLNITFEPEPMGSCSASSSRPMEPFYCLRCSTAFGPSLDPNQPPHFIERPDLLLHIPQNIINISGHDEKCPEHDYVVLDPDPISFIPAVGARPVPFGFVPSVRTSGAVARGIVVGTTNAVPFGVPAVANKGKGIRGKRSKLVLADDKGSELDLNLKLRNGENH